MLKNLIFPIEFDHFTGGMIHSVISLVKYFKKDYNVCILAYKDAEVFKLGLDVTNLTLQKPWCISATSPMKTIKTYAEVNKLMQQFKKEETLVFTNNVGSEMIFSGFGFFPINYTRVFVSRGGDYKGKTGWIVKRGFKTVSKFISISNRQVNILLNAGIKKDNISLIFNGVLNTSLPGSAYVFNKTGTIQISVVGYLYPDKNQQLLVEALELLKNEKNKININFYGDDTTPGKSYTTFLENLIKAYGLSNNVIFHGFQKNKNKIFSTSDIIVSCSLSEGFGRTIAEAMSYGIPCIGLKESGGLTDIITPDYDGILISNDKNELAGAIRKICQNAAFRSALSKNGLETYNTKFTEDIMCYKYKLFLESNFDVQ